MLCPLSYGAIRCGWWSRTTNPLVMSQGRQSKASSPAIVSRVGVEPTQPWATGLQPAYLAIDCLLISQSHSITPWQWHSQGGRNRTYVLPAPNGAVYQTDIRPDNWPLACADSQGPSGGGGSRTRVHNVLPYILYWHRLIAPSQGRSFLVSGGVLPVIQDQPTNLSPLVTADLTKGVTRL